MSLSGQLKIEEKRTLELLSQGFTIKDIADVKMHKSVESINLYIRSAKDKLNAKTRDQLIALAIKGNFIDV